jgi:hypothetical protein
MLKKIIGFSLGHISLALLWTYVAEDSFADRPTRRTR